MYNAEDSQVGGQLGVQVAIEDKYGRLKQLMDVGKEKGYVLYDEVSELLPDDIHRAQNSMSCWSTSTAPASRSSKNPSESAKIEDAEELGELELGSGIQR